MLRNLTCIVWCVIVVGLVASSPIRSKTSLFQTEHLFPLRANVGALFPGCPAIVKPPKNPPMLPSSLVDYIGSFIANYTTAPCEEAPLPPLPSATAFSMVVLVGGEDGPGKTVFRNYGCVNKSDPLKTPPTEDTVYRLASVSKTFTVEMVLNAVNEGRIKSWNDQIVDYFPDLLLKNPYGDGASPTFKQLCSQLAGLPREAPCDFANCSMSNDEMIQRLNEYVMLILPPNSRPSYSNLAYSLLGHLVAERLYGVSWETHLLNTITKRLGMNSTGLNFSEEIRKRMAVEYQYGGIPVNPLEQLGWSNPCGGMYSTTRDLAIWMRHYLADWEKSAWRKETMLPIFINNDQFSAFGSPWEFFATNGYWVAGKTGGLAGVSSFIALVPELSIAMGFLWNGEGVSEFGFGEFAFRTAIPSLLKQYKKANAAAFPVFDPSFCTEGFCNRVYSLTVNGQVVASANVSLATNTTISNVPFVKLTLQAGPPGETWYVLVPFQDKTNGSSNGVYEYAFQMLPIEDPSMSCFGEEGDASLGEWIYFSHDPVTGKHRVLAPGSGYFRYFTG